MAKLSKDDVLKLARLARLRLSEDETSAFQKEIGDILGYVEMLKDVDVKGLKPTYQVTGLQNVSRPDEIKSYAASPDALRRTVPAHEGRYIKVKRMIG
jgi:aspartyl-tRNA(Asn)/glutamyl-tRNA(Gln) amidotransferase subunit C